MAKKKTTAQKAARAAEKAAKKNPKVFFAIVAIVLVIAIVAGLCWYFFVYKKQPEGGGTTPVLTGNEKEIASADLSVHFLELGSKNVGDCVLIKTGNTEVLIDAGAKANQAPTKEMQDYVAKYCTDGKLEYVIATHAHEDHIAGLVGQASGNTRTGFLYQYQIGTIIYYAGQKTNSAVSQNFDAAVKYCKEKKDAKAFTALECVNGENGAQKTYYLNEARTISMTILYQKYYEEFTSNENNYSVCMLLSQTTSAGTNNYLFTGDLEKSGEESLVQSNPDLPHCELYKGGHHGSSTSSNDVLLEKITPENIAICTCAGTYEYAAKPTAEKPENYLNTFPTQEAIDRMGRHTKNIYVTTLGILNEDYSTKEYVSMNGNIVFYYGGEGDEKSLKLYCSNNTTVLKDTQWFQNNRTWNGI